ncbi:MAG: M48 family metalloprotease, partial [Acetobacteraceae bacterium]|nr:M48 family metalloprotease [Acetobacteraceae bacterium]
VDRRTDPRLVNIVETQAIAAGLPPPKVGLVDSPALNAFACGLSARSAVVVATRGLVETLEDGELAAVVAHEIAHIRNGDIRLMAAANVLMDNLEWLRRRNPLRIGGYGRALLAVLVPPFLLLCLAAGAVTAVAFTLARVSRLLISSSREFVADAEAVRMTHDPAALISALRRIEGRSAVEGMDARIDAMMIDGAVQGAFASHPTIAERVAVLSRLLGALAQEPGAAAHARPDRTAGGGGGGDRGFGRKGAPGGPWAAPAPPRSLIARVNAGPRENLLGLTPARRRVIVLGFAGLFALQAWTVLRFQAPGGAGPAVPREHVGAALKAVRDGEGGPLGMTGKFGNTQRRSPRQELQRLAATDPVAARCFATAGTYEVGDRGLHRVSPPDPKLVQAFSVEENNSSDIRLERYLGLKLRWARAVSDAGSAELDQRMAEYVKGRKRLLETLHRFFGEPGLRLMQEAYESPEDRAILATLRRRFGDRAPALVSDGRFAAEIALLLSAPESFVPCAARAGLSGPVRPGAPAVAAPEL